MKGLQEKITGKEKEVLKENALNQIFKNMDLGLRDSFKKWRDINVIANSKLRIDNGHKATHINILEIMMSHARASRLQEVIRKFKLNRDTILIQRNFLKKLLSTKTGLIEIAFQRIQALPHRRQKSDPSSANSFEKGLDKWIRDKLKYVFDQFKLEGEYGNVMKKRAAILMVKMSESKVKRSYGRWHHFI